MVRYLIAALLATTIAAGGVASCAMGERDEALAKVAALEQAAEIARRVAEDQIATDEKRMEDRVHEAQTIAAAAALEAERARRDSAGVLDAYRGLRDQVAAYGRSAAADDPAAACRGAAVSDLLAESVGLLDEAGRLLLACAADHDTAAGQVRSLIHGWPK
jgi:hypothetical protein